MVMKNLRMSRRVAVDSSASFENDSGRVEGAIKELSEGGLRFECREELELGTSGVFTFKILMDEPEVSITGEPIHRTEVSRHGGKVYQYGVRFTDLDSRKKEALARVQRYATLRQRYSVKRSDIIKDGG